MCKGVKLTKFPFHTSIGYYKESKFQHKFDDESIHKSDNITNKFLRLQIYGFFHETNHWKSYRIIE